MSEEENEEESKWYNNIFIIDILIFIFSFVFLALGCLVMYICYPPVLMAFQT
jgi:hypothetical protein